MYMIEKRFINYEIDKSLVVEETLNIKKQLQCWTKRSRKFYLHLIDSSICKSMHAMHYPNVHFHNFKMSSHLT